MLTQKINESRVHALLLYYAGTMSEFVWNFSLLFTTNNSNEHRLYQLTDW
jgi:hypothetical protein